MQKRKRSIEQIVEEQVQRWDYARRESSPSKNTPSVITLSREPGSGGDLVAEGIAQRLEYDLFHQNMIHEMARSAHVSSRLVQSLDEKRLNTLEDSIASLVHHRHLWPDEYLKHLLKVIGTIGKHGHAVIVGRGANFILPQRDIFRLRIIAPKEFRAEKVAETYNISLDEARRRIIKTESDRRAFVRKYFHEEITHPTSYDLVINTSTVSIEEAVESVCGILNMRK